MTRPDRRAARRRTRPAAVAAFALLALIAASGAPVRAAAAGGAAGPAAAGGCQGLRAAPARPAPLAAGVRAGWTVDQVWSGTEVDFDAVATEETVYLGYFGADRRLTVAAFDRRSAVVTVCPLPDLFSGWDPHNYVRLALDAHGILHVAGNMHGTRLVYGRMTRAGDLSSLTLLNTMTGEAESRVTYPEFLPLPDGRLAFLYRDGVSGNGRELINVFDGRGWRRLTDRPLFAPSAGGTHASAYHTPPALGPDGWFHLAWVWRMGNDAGTNALVSYARSRDLAHWTDGDGRPIALPMTPGDGDIADPLQPGTGLMNHIKLGFDPAGRPVISYVKYDAAGDTQLYNARRDRTGWSIFQLSHWHGRWELQGVGSIPEQIVIFAIVPTAAGTLSQGGRHWLAGPFNFVVDAETYAPVAAPEAAPRPAVRPLPAPLLQRETGLPDFAVHVRRGRADDGHRPTPFYLRWETQQTDHDRPQDCTPDRPLACNPPPTALRLYEVE